MFNDFLERLGNWKTTIIGVSGGIVVILVVLGIVGKDESGEIVPLIDSILGAIMAFVLAVQSLILIFSKDK